MNTLRGMTTVSYWTDDMPAARRWYAELLGIEPYFAMGDGYVEFRIGDYQHELGIIHRSYAPAGTATGPSLDDPAARPGGAILYWHVDDVNAMVERLVELGATPHEPVTKRGEGFVTASVIDPFGNILGVMENRHYLDVLAS